MTGLELRTTDNLKQLLNHLSHLHNAAKFYYTFLDFAKRNRQPDDQLG